MYFVSICKDSILCNYMQKHNKYFAEDVFYFSNYWLDIFYSLGQIGTVQDKFGQPLPPVQI